MVDGGFETWKISRDVKRKKVATHEGGSLLKAAAVVCKLFHLS